jgi:hypothetical protein
MVRRDWHAAADAFGAVGWSYDRELMLSLAGDEDALTEAIVIAHALGAVPLARRVAQQLRARGLRVPRGPRERTRSNRAGLTGRQLEVLTLLRRAIALIAASRKSLSLARAGGWRQSARPGRTSA